ncbi:MAG: aspartate kinase [Deltaproteobacteria bacterium]|nr:aspartate kinase [Deltaproteobacteria bacterium]
MTRPLVVQKFGGTSVGTVERIQEVARRVAEGAQASRLIVVVSAMSGETDRLLKLARALSPDPLPRESDVVVASGEQVTSALLSIALDARGVPAQSFLGHQICIHTDDAHTKARIRSIDSARMFAALDAGKVVVVAGFQGVDGNGNITTLGRGGSDTTAVALAAATGADACEIYTDVDGVYTTDPRIVSHAHKLERISYDEMLELASLGAKVLQIRSVEFAKRYNVRVHVRSSFNDEPGTWVVPEESNMEEVTVAGVAFDRDQSKITLTDVPDRPGLAARIFSPIAAKGIVVDMIIQNTGAAGKTDMTFTVPRVELDAALRIVRDVAREIGAGDARSEGDITKVSVVGLGMRSHAGVAAQIFETLAREGINIQMISTSEIKVSVVIDAKYTELAVRVLHDAFLGAKETNG